MPFFKREPKIRLTSAGVLKSYDLIAHTASDFDLFLPGDVSGPLLRDFHVIRYCVSGRGIVELNGISYPVSPGNAYLCFAGDVMTEATDGDQAWVMVYVTLLGAKAPMLFEAMGVSSETPFFPWDSNPEFLNCLYKAIGSLLAEDIQPDSELHRIALAYSLMDELLARYRKKEASTARQIQEEYVNQALHFMETHCVGKLSVSDIAAHVGLNRSYFYTLFKRLTGQSPQEHLTKLRISKACDLFSYPHSTVENVANSVGLDITVFYRHFKAMVGMSPSEYKKRCAQAQD